MTDDCRKNGKASSMLIVGRVLSASVLCLFLAGCITTQYGTATERRNWELEYKEKVKVTTEPTGCRVYVQDHYSGTSPLEVTLSGGELHVAETGTYRQEYQFDEWDGSRSGHKRVGPTTWSGSLHCSSPGGGWTIRAFHDGYKSAETRIIDGKTNAWARAVRELEVDGRQLPSVVTGQNSILLVLEPLPGYVGQSSPKQQQQQQQQTVVFGPQGEAQQVGVLMVSSDVQGADVFVDGVFVGNAPANLKLKEGIHIIEVKKQGCSTYRKQLRVFGGSELSIRAEISK